MNFTNKNVQQKGVGRCKRALKKTFIVMLKKDVIPFTFITGRLTCFIKKKFNPRMHNFLVAVTLKLGHFQPTSRQQLFCRVSDYFEHLLQSFTVS